MVIKIGNLLFEYLMWSFYMGLMQWAAQLLWGPGQHYSMWLLGALAVLCRWVIEQNLSDESPVAD